MIKSAWLQLIVGIKQSKYTISSGTSLLDCRKPLPKHSYASCDCIRCFKDIPCCVDIGSACAHGAIHLHASPTGNAAAFNEIDKWLDAYRHDHHVAGDTCPGCRDHARYS